MVEKYALEPCLGYYTWSRNRIVYIDRTFQRYINICTCVS